MTELTLATKVYNSNQMRHIGQVLAEIIGDLSVEISVKGTLARKWVQVELSGEDEAIATKLLQREIGLCPISLDNVKKFSEHRGYVISSDGKAGELLVDIGVTEPKTVPAYIQISHLQMLLFNGKKASIREITDWWGICENFPLQVKVLEVNTEENRIHVDLEAGFVKRLDRWKGSLLDRLIIIGASSLEIKGVIEQERLDRDIIDVEELGVFEHALVCKLGTDAAGLICRIGRRMRKANFVVFNPKK